MIELRNIRKSYANNSVTAHVLNGIDMDIEAGEFVTLMGPSGAGKSTLLHIIGMLDNPTDGEYRFLDTDIAGLSERHRSGLHRDNIGFVFQSYHLIDDLTVYENLETPLLYQKVKSPERKSRVCDTLDRFNIVGKKDLFPHQLSGGQQQLVAVARALISNPKVVLADEPTGNLHSEEGDRIMKLFQKLNSDGTTIVQATHSDAGAKYSRRVVRMLDGRLISE